ncbi:MAG: IS1182 family transposase [Boseongicola sp.]|nr:IS1182 family transposase [Boseongicola sp.]
MDHVIGLDRSQTQLLPPCLEDYVSDDAPVRVIDAYVDSLDLVKLGFKHATPKRLGRRAYDPGMLLKLYLYGYLNRTRSSRRLEQETKRNLELKWLVQGLEPDHKTISDFRKDNKSQFKKVFREFNLLCRQLKLFEAELVAIDGSKFKAVSNPRNHFTKKQLQETVEKVDKGIAAYLEKLDREDDQALNGLRESKETLEKKIASLKSRKARLKEQLESLEKSGEQEIGGHDSEARQMKISKAPSVGYNVQTAVDTKHHLIAAQEVVTEANDLRQLEPMSQAAKEELEVEKLGVLADSGYHQFQHLKACEEQGIETYVARPKTSSGRGSKGNRIYPKEQFQWDEEKDVYRCPAGQELKGGKLRNKPNGKVREFQNRKACKGCELKAKCTEGKYRTIQRWEGEEAVKRTEERLRAHPKRYALRKSVVEHVFGTMRIWGQDKFLTRGLEKVSAEFSLTALSYNLTRAINIVGVAGLLEAIEEN